jgi:hypothetical protein
MWLPSRAEGVSARSLGSRASDTIRLWAKIATAVASAAAARASGAEASTSTVAVLVRKATLSTEKMGGSSLGAACAPCLITAFPL